MTDKKLRTLLILPELTIKQAMQKLNETSAKILFVVEKNNILLGTVTDGDIRRGLINDCKFTDSVESIMHKEFTSLSVTQSRDTNTVIQLMVQKKIEQIPVVNELGIIEKVVLWTDILGESVPRTSVPKPNTVVIMAGGQGARLDPFTKVLPKPLIPIGNKPVIEVIMDNFYRSGFNKFVYTLNYKKEYIKLYLKEINCPYTIDWVEEEDFLGTAGGLILLKEKVTDAFFVTNCDSLLEIDFDEVLKWHKEQNAAVTVIGCHNEVNIPYGVLTMSNGRLENILEKPVHDVIINTGVYIVEPYVISMIPENKPTDMDWLLGEVLKSHKVSVYPIYGGWFDLGQWTEYQKTLKAMKELD